MIDTEDIFLSLMKQGGAPRTLRAGVARVNITPPPGAPHYFGKTMRSFEILNSGIHDSLYARVLALSDGEQSLTIVSLDLIGFDPSGVRAHLPSNLRTSALLSATHNHESPAVLRFQAPPNVYRTPYLDQIEQEIASAIIAAHAHAVLARIGVGMGTVDLSYNRLTRAPGEYLCGANKDRIRFGPLDPEVGVIRVDDLSGKPLAVLVHYTAHPTILIPVDIVSAGYPGYMCRFVEEEIGEGVTCLFVNGACGDIEPFDACSDSFEKAEAMGRVLADTVLNVHARTEALLRQETQIDFRSEALSLSDIDFIETTYETELSMAVINREIALVGMPGEIFVDFQLELKRRSPVAATFLLGYTNGYLGYFPTKQAVEENWGFGANYHGRWTAVGAGERMLERALEYLIPGTKEFTTVAGTVPLPLDIAVELEVAPEATRPTLSLDLSAVGGDASLPLIHEGGGRYRARTQITQVLDNGVYFLPILSAQGDQPAQLFYNFRLRILPDEEQILFADHEAPAWEEIQQVSLDPQTPDPVFEGETSLGVQARIGALFGWVAPEPVKGFGYRLHLAFHPGEATGSLFNLSIKGTSGNTLQSVELIGDSEESLGLDLEDKVWQEVDLPLDFRDPNEPIQTIQFSGLLRGTYYLDDIRLVPQQLPPPDTAVLEEQTDALPQSFILSQNYPNPFNSATVIHFALPTAADVELAIFNLAGQQVATLADGAHAAGTYILRWDGYDDDGRTLASGVYLYRLRAGKQQVETRKLVLVR